MSNERGERGKRRQIYLPQRSSALAEQLAAAHHDGNVSALIVAALDDYVARREERGPLIRQVVLDLAAMLEDDRADPLDSSAAPRLILAALLDEEAAAAIEDALDVLWGRWSLERTDG